MRKKLALIFACIMLISVFTACAAPEEAVATPAPTPAAGAGEEAPAVPTLDPITFTMFVGSPGQAPSPDAPIIKKIQELTGVTIEFEFLVGDLAQKSGVMIASGDYPDFINPSDERSKFIEAGAFIPLDDIIYTYPNIREHFELYDDRLRAISPDNKIYIMDVWGRNYGEIFESGFGGPAFWIQKSVLSDAGYPRPTTLEEYFTLLENYAAKNPEIDGQPVAPFEILSDGWRAFCLMNPPQHLVGGPNDGGVFVNQETMQAEIYANKDYAKTYFAKLNEMYLKGLISPETFTQTYDQYLAKLSSGRVLGMFDQGWNFGGAVDLLIRDGRLDRTWVPLELTYEGYEPWYRERPMFIGGNGMGITVNNKDVDRSMAFIDRLLDEDIQRMLSWGIEGEHFFVDDAGRYYLTEEIRVQREDPNFAIQTGIFSQFWANFPKMQGSFSNGNGIGPGSQPEEVFAGMEQYDKDFLAQYDFSAFSEFMTMGPETPAYYPVWAFTVPEGTPAALAMAQIEDLQRTYLPRLIMSDAGTFDAAWAAYVAEIAKVDYPAYEAEVNRQIAERMGR